MNLKTIKIEVGVLNIAEIDYLLQQNELKKSALRVIQEYVDCFKQPPVPDTCFEIGEGEKTRYYFNILGVTVMPDKNSVFFTIKFRA